MAINFEEKYAESLQIKDEDKQKFMDLILAKGMERLEDLVGGLSSAKYQEQLNELKKRYNDPILKLAIIGDFNTGKSTFINALLKKPYLSTDNVPTTVIPTYMRWDGDKEAAPLMKISLIGDEGEYTIQEHRAFLEKRFKMELLEDQDENIERISTNNNLIGIVSHISISFPKDERYEHFCLIDTPGVNPGTEETREHANITREVLRKEADTTIILFPSHTMGQRSALEYISENASHLFDGASFVITKMDMVEGEKEETKLPSLLKGLVKQNFDLDIPKVYTCSARYALAHYTGNVNSPKYAQQFDEMINDIFENLNRKRKQIICKKMMDLMSLLIEELKSEYEALSKELHEKMDTLERYSLDSLEKEYAQMLHEYRVNIEKKYRTARNQIYIRTVGLKDNFMKKALNEFKFISRSALERYVRDEFVYSIEAHMLSDISGMREEYDDFSIKVFECMKEYQMQIDKPILNSVYKEEHSFLPVIRVDVSMSGFMPDIGTNESFAAIIILIIGAIAILFTRNPSAYIIALAERRLTEAMNRALPSIEQEWEYAIGSARNKYESVGIELMEKYQEEYAELFEDKRKIYEDVKKKLEASISAVKYNLQLIEIIETALKVPFKLDTYTECNRPLLKIAISGDCNAMDRIGYEYKHSDEQKSLDWLMCRLLVSRRDILKKMY